MAAAIRAVADLRSSNSSQSSRSSLACSAGSRPKMRSAAAALADDLFGLGGRAGVEEGVAGVDLDDVVDGEHEGEAHLVDRLV